MVTCIPDRLLPKPFREQRVLSGRCWVVLVSLQETMSSREAVGTHSVSVRSETVWACTFRSGFRALPPRVLMCSGFASWLYPLRDVLDGLRVPPSLRLTFDLHTAEMQGQRFMKRALFDEDPHQLRVFCVLKGGPEEAVEVMEDFGGPICRLQGQGKIGNSQLRLAAVINRRRPQTIRELRCLPVSKDRAALLAALVLTSTVEPHGQVILAEKPSLTCPSWSNCGQRCISSRGKLGQFGSSLSSTRAASTLLRSCLPAWLLFHPREPQYACALHVATYIGERGAHLCLHFPPAGRHPVLPGTERNCHPAL